MAEFNTNIWAPWRMEYIRSLGEQQKEEGCFLCRYWATPENDVANRVVWRGQHIFVVMNRFPYTNGHLLVALAEHKADMEELGDEQLADLSRGIRDAVRLLRATLRPQGFNIGYNISHCAGAGLPDHLHAHVVPRWSGDTNFMAVLGDIRVVPDALDALYRELANALRAQA